MADSRSSISCVPDLGWVSTESCDIDLLARMLRAVERFWDGSLSLSFGVID